jgi:hypothetical protein
MQRPHIPLCAAFLFLNGTIIILASADFFLLGFQGKNRLGSVLRLHMDRRRNLRNVALMGMSDSHDGVLVFDDAVDDLFFHAFCFAICLSMIFNVLL